MKKYISLGVCAALVVCSAVFMQKEEEVVAGPGKGKNAEVKTLQQLSDVLETFVGYGSPYSMMATPMASSDEEYESVTIDIDTVMGFSLNGSGLDSSISMNKSMKYYFTEDAKYYDTQVSIKEKAPYSVGRESETMTMFMDLHIEIYHDDEEEISLIRFNKWEFSANKELLDTSELMNKWINLDGMKDDIVSDITEKITKKITENNCKIFQTIVSDIYSADLEKEFKKNEDVYTFDKNFALDLCEDIFEQRYKALLFNSPIKTNLKEKFDCKPKEPSFSVDLSSRTMPLMELSYKMKETSGSSSISAGEHDTFLLSNINNTKINFPKNVRIYNPFEDFSEDFLENFEEFFSNLDW